MTPQILDSSGEKFFSNYFLFKNQCKQIILFIKARFKITFLIVCLFFYPSIYFVLLIRKPLSSFVKPIFG